MLVLTRKQGQRLVIGDVVVTICEIRGRSAVRIGIDAPKEISIVRGELLKRDRTDGTQNRT